MTNLGKESETVEFKESMAQLDNAVKALSAMLNRHHRGTVYIGVRDDGEVIGMEVGDSTLERIRNAVRTDIAPQVVPVIERLVSDDSRNYVSVSVTGHSVPYSCKDRYYIRNVASNETAGPEVLVQIAMTRGMDPLKDTPSDVQELTFRDLNTIMSSYGYHTRDDANYYRSIGFLDSEGRFNLTAYLLSDQNSFPMQIVEFRGKDRTALSDRRDMGGCCLLTSMERVSEYVFVMNETRIDTDVSLSRKETHLFDFGAFREAWVNACVHNAWRSYTPPSVLVFEDRIEIVSYGRIPFPASDEDFFTGDSRPVNPALFSVFGRTDKTEQTGHGVPRIVGAYGRGAFRIADSGLKVTIPFAFESRFVRMRKELSEERKGMSRNESAIIESMERNSRVKLSEISDSTGMSLSLVKKLVSSMKSRGMIENTGTNRNSVWSVR